MIFCQKTKTLQDIHFGIDFESEFIMIPKNAPKFIVVCFAYNLYYVK